MFIDYFKAGEQATFDAAARHLLTQMKKSEGKIANKDGVMEHSCLYRSPDGLKCAIGALIDDSEYKPELETISAFVVSKKLIKHNAEDYDECKAVHDFGRFVAHLQQLHDIYKPEHWASELRIFARQHGLNTKAIDEAQN